MRYFSTPGSKICLFVRHLGEILLKSWPVLSALECCWVIHRVGDILFPVPSCISLLTSCLLWKTISLHTHSHSLHVLLTLTSVGYHMLKALKSQANMKLPSSSCSVCQVQWPQWPKHRHSVSNVRVTRICISFGCQTEHRRVMCAHTRELCLLFHLLMATRLLLPFACGKYCCKYHFEFLLWVIVPEVELGNDTLIVCLSFLGTMVLFSVPRVIWMFQFISR